MFGLALWVEMWKITFERLYAQAGALQPCADPCSNSQGQTLTGVGEV